MSRSAAARMGNCGKRITSTRFIRRRSRTALVGDQVTTASGITASLTSFFHGRRLTGIRAPGTVRLPEVLANRFGAWYHGTDKSISARIVVEGKAGRQRSRAGALK